MAPQALLLSGLYVQPVVLSLQDMMAYISPRFWAVGHYLCFCCGAEFLSATVTQVAHSSGTCCTLSQLPVPQQPKGKRSACSYTPAPDVIVQQTFLFTNYRKRASGHLIWRSRRRDVARLLRSPFSSGLRVWAGGQTSSHFQSKDGLRDVFFLCATTHPCSEGIYFSPAPAHKPFRFVRFFSSGLACYAAASHTFKQTFKQTSTFPWRVWAKT